MRTKIIGSDRASLEITVDNNLMMFDFYENKKRCNVPTIVLIKCDCKFNQVKELLEFLQNG